MNLLLDTHALLWALAEPQRFTEAARLEVANPANDVFVSVVTGWEMAIKAGLGKLAIPPDLQDWLPPRLSADRFAILPITLEHALGVERLPRHHRDPFDRLLMAQAVAEDMAIVTRDRIFDHYEVRLLPC